MALAVRLAFVLLFCMPGFIAGNSNAGCELKMDQALLTLHNQLPAEIRVSYVSDFCYKCLFQPLATVKGNGNASVVLSTRFALTLTVTSEAENFTLCRLENTFGETGFYSVWVNGNSCLLRVERSPINSYIPILVAALIMLLCTALYISLPYLSRWRHTAKLMDIISCKMSPNTEADGEDVRAKPKSTRLKSLDTFRGFSLTVMVFVNYGGGGYWFYEHAPWNGLTVADCVMPWFVFIIGTSVVLALNTLWNKRVSRLQLLRKISWRSAVLILIGFCFINYSPRDGLLSWSWARVPGVLQRLGFTYFILSLMQMCSIKKAIPLIEYHWWNPLQDILLYWPEWLFILSLETLWLCFTFLLPVPDCPTGYLGAGGIGDDGLYPNCTGGAAGYIDRVILGKNMYGYPTCKELYRTTQPFDPEGILGTINCVVLGFTGMQAGKILIFYRSRNLSILKRFLVWAVVLGIFAAILSKCTRDEGFIPVNKNLWSLSYISCMGCFSFLLLLFLYFVIDVKSWWGGEPFIYPGMNSILVYVGHSLLGFYFPFSWEMATESHAEFLFRSMLGTALWLFIAYLLYRKRFFLKI